jgi:hypothetical protein
MELPEETLTLLKALVDTERLKILGLLALEKATAVQLAEKLHTRPAALLRHLDYLVEAQLVIATSTKASTVYEFNARQLETVARQVLAGSRPAVEVPKGDLDEDERKIVANFSNPDGTFKMIPLQPKKLLAILHHIVPAFEEGVQYTEKEINEILSRFHPDAASLRRYLVEHKMLARARDGAHYWRV